MVGKLSIANEMRAIDTKNRNWYKTLDDEERVKYDKQLWIQQRWASSVQGGNAAQYLILVNDYSNVFPEKGLRSHEYFKRRASWRRCY